MSIILITYDKFIRLNLRAVVDRFHAYPKRYIFEDRSRLLGTLISIFWHINGQIFIANSENGKVAHKKVAQPLLMV